VNIHRKKIKEESKAYKKISYYLLTLYVYSLRENNLIFTNKINACREAVNQE